VLAAAAPVAIPFALAGGSLIFIAVVVGLFFAVVYGYYTRRGSGISQTPYRRPDAPPETPSELAHDTTQDVHRWERGTAGHHRSRPAPARRPPEAVAQALADWRSSSIAPALDPPIGPSDRVRGPAQAPTLAVYLDVSSEPCRSAYRLLCGLAAGEQIRLAVRQLPLADVHPLSLTAAEALEAAAAHGKFFALLDQLAASGVRDETELLELASRYVPDPDRLQQDARAGRYRASVVQQIRQATASGAHAVPEIYINGSHYGGPIRRDELDRTLRRLTASS
jgi:predicted DsbA family dithiol-disulfide isomerase